ncbi:MAG: hypothetical protein R6V05_05205 [Candidatus Brocadiia bacterium]
MSAGRVWPAEGTTYADPISGARVRRLTDYRAHPLSRICRAATDGSGAEMVWEEKTWIGHVRYDNTERVEVDFPFETGHIHSNDHRLIVGDAGSVVRLWRWNGEGYDGPRVLCEHRCSKHIQNLHVHPRFSPDGTEALFTSDKSGYGNVYLAEAPGFRSLPLLQEVAGRSS